MKVHEWMGKKLLESYGIAVPRSILVKQPLQLKNAALQNEIASLEFPQVIKSQVLVGGRMKAGGVLFSNSLSKTLELTERLFSKEIRGEKPSAVLIERGIPHTKEWYISLSIDRQTRDIMVVFSEHGGIDIEKIAEKAPETIVKTDIPHAYKILPPMLQNLLERLHRLMIEKDLTLIEVNPLSILENEPIALDAVLHVDDNALFRQTWVGTEPKNDFHFVKLNGTIGIIGCGAGIVMATMDAIKMRGCEPANFLDIGGGGNRQTTLKALRKLQDIQVKMIIMNIFGGITLCDEVAKAIIAFKKEAKIPIFIRITGTNEDIAKEMLERHGIQVFESMDELVDKSTKFAKEAGIC